MGWIDHAIWWHVYPLGFTGAPIREDHGTPRPRLRRLIPWLDHAIALGCSGLLLGPIFASETHGYDTTDLLGIDPRLGTLEDFDDLVAQCRARGLRLVLDGVFSHVGRGHPRVEAELRSPDPDPTRRLFDIDRSTAEAPTPRVFEGHDSLVRFDHSSPAVRDHVRSVMTYWLGRGADGWRLDAAYSVPPEFWAQVLPPVRDQYPDAWFLGEVLHGDYTEFVSRSGVDTVTQYELWKAIWSSIVDRNFFELDWSLQRHNTFLEHFVPQTFIGNHDVTRIASRVGQDGSALALAILMTVGGIPSIYYGDEQGRTGIKEERLGGDDAIRPSFPEAPDAMSSLGDDMVRAHQELIGMRRRYPWLLRARTQPLVVENERYRYRTSSEDGSQSLEVELDLSNMPRATVTDPFGTVVWTSG